MNSQLAIDVDIAVAENSIGPISVYGNIEGSFIGENLLEQGRHKHRP